MKTQAVIGLGFGDEGKGKVVSYLCSQTIMPPLVIRYSGGHQAGHHVVIKDTLSHVFASFGSGTLQGCDTYWSPFCTIHPMAILNELEVLKNNGVNPRLFIDGRCPVTTPVEVEANIAIDKESGHGTCGVGFGETIKREESGCSFTFTDLFFPYVVPDFAFAEDCKKLIEHPSIRMTLGVPARAKYERYIFEGSQGLMLDQDIGFFPHVTRSNVGSKNILALRHEPDELYLVTRAYQTRHGNGPMSNEGLSHNIQPNPYEQNHDDGVQGCFRIAPLDIDLLKYAIDKDDFIRKSQNKTLVITCMDLVQDSFTLTGANRKIIECSNENAFVRTISDYLGIKNVLISRSPRFDEMEVFEK